jgi:SAM-dependent methyltransferase
LLILPLMDVFGKALNDFYRKGSSKKLWLHNSYGKPEEMPVDIFFRDEAELTELELTALSFCRGQVLDIGAGTGAHSLVLQGRGFDVSALEISPAASKIMTKRGIRQVINRDINAYAANSYDTLLMLMNGIGLCGDIAGLHVLLPHLKSLLKPQGQILLDSSDISYLYPAGNFPHDSYYGEISYQYEYQGDKGSRFKWLYIDFDYLTNISAGYGLSCEMLFEDDTDQYLARLSIS